MTDSCPNLESIIFYDMNLKFKYMDLYQEIRNLNIRNFFILFKRRAVARSDKWVDLKKFI